jgi:hypothetical protein
MSASKWPPRIQWLRRLRPTDVRVRVATAPVARPPTESGFHPTSRFTVLQLKPHPDRPNVLRFQWTLLPGQTALVPGNVLQDCLRRADRALLSSRRSAGEASLSERRVTESLLPFGSGRPAYRARPLSDLRAGRRISGCPRGSVARSTVFAGAST